MDLSSRRCSTCILPETPSLVTLDDTGTCNHCRAFEERYGTIDDKTLRAREARFTELLRASKMRTRSYDCLVPVSGGKDSMYALYVCTKTYGLRVLAYNFDNGFQSAQAVTNIRTAIDRLGVDFVQVKPSERTLFELYRLFLQRTGSFCAPCNRIIAESGLRLAKQYGIPVIVTGNSRRWSAAIRGMSISKYSNNPFFWNVVDGHADGEAVENLVRRKYARDDVLKVARIGVRTISLFEYVNPTKERLLETLEDGLGWKSPSEALEHGDCLVTPIKDYLACRKWGFSEVTGGYATQVRNGKMPRERALLRAEEEEPREEPAVLGTFLDKIGLTRPEFEEAVEQRYFTDVSNEFGRIYRTAQWVKRALR